MNIVYDIMSDMDIENYRVNSHTDMYDPYLDRIDDTPDPEYTEEQKDYIRKCGGVFDEHGGIRITYKSFRKIPKDYASRDICDRRRHVWLIPNSMLLIEWVHFVLVKEL